MEKINQIELINRYIVDYVYNSAKVEGIPTTYLQTKILIDKNKAPELDFYDVVKLKNLKDAYKLLINNDFYNEPCDIYSLYKINYEINKGGLVKFPGVLRKEEVSIGGTSYIPSIPNQYDINNMIIDIVNDSSIDPFTRGATLFAKLVKAQPFIDGNKRTSMIFANHYLLQNGYGIFSIPENKDNSFFEHLVNYYEDETKINELTDFLKEECYSSWKLENDDFIL